MKRNFPQKTGKGQYQVWIIFCHFYPLEYSNDESKGEDFPEEVKGTVYQCVNLKGKGRER